MLALALRASGNVCSFGVPVCAPPVCFPCPVPIDDIARTSHNTTLSTLGLTRPISPARNPSRWVGGLVLRGGGLGGLV